MERDPQTGLLTVRARDDLDERDLYAMAGAKWLCQAGGTLVDGSSPACRTSWRMWARQVLTDAGLSILQGLDFVLGLRPFGPGEVPGRSPALAPVIRGFAGRLCECDESYPPESAVHYAILLEATCMMLDAATAEQASDEQTLFSLRAATIIGWLHGDVLTQRLLPFAHRGAMDLAGKRKGGRLGNKTRREEAQERHAAWAAYAAKLRQKAPDLSERAIAARVAREFGVHADTVRRTL